MLDLADKYDWDVTLPIVIDREKGSHNRLTGGKPVSYTHLVAETGDR